MRNSLLWVVDARSEGAELNRRAKQFYVSSAAMNVTVIPAQKSLARPELRNR